MKRLPARKECRREGWQLVELSMVLALFAIVGGAATRVIVGLMAIESRSGQALQDAEILNRLGRQWREDLHRASSAVIGGDGKSLQIDLVSGARVTYQAADQRLTRQQTRPGQRRPAQEAFTASARGWRFEQSDDRQIVSVVREYLPAGLMRATNPAGPFEVDRIQGAIGVYANPASPPQAEGGGP